MDALTFRRFLMEQEIRDAIDRATGPDSIQTLVREVWWNPMSWAGNAPPQVNDPQTAMQQVKDTVLKVVQDKVGDAAWSAIPMGSIVGNVFNKGASFIRKLFYPVPKKPDQHSTDWEKKDYELAQNQRSAAGEMAGIQTKLVTGVLSFAIFAGAAMWVHKQIEEAGVRKGQQQWAGRVQELQKQVQDLEAKAKEQAAQLTPEQRRAGEAIAKAAVPDYMTPGDRAAADSAKADRDSEEFYGSLGPMVLKRIRTEYKNKLTPRQMASIGIKEIYTDIDYFRKTAQEEKAKGGHDFAWYWYDHDVESLVRVLAYRTALDASREWEGMNRRAERAGGGGNSPAQRGGAAGGTGFLPRSGREE